jgi:hypothetical protein
MSVLTEMCNLTGLCDCFYDVTSVGLTAVLAGQCNWSELLQFACAVISVKINDMGFVCLQFLLTLLIACFFTLHLFKVS